MRTVFVTTNEDKRREAQEILGMELEIASLGDNDLPEVQSLDFAEVAEHKARAARMALGSPPYPIIVEDSGLVVGAWDGLPGALTKWFLASVGNEGLLRMLSGWDRGARAVCAVAVAGADGGVRVFEGVVEGEVAAEPRGEGGFGWDPIFVPRGSRLTYAEMGDDKHTDSHRTRAFRRLRAWLEEQDERGV